MMFFLKYYFLKEVASLKINANSEVKFIDLRTKYSMEQRFHLCDKRTPYVRTSSISTYVWQDSLFLNG